MLITGICHKLPIPFTVILVMVGMLLGKLSYFWEFLEPLQHFHLSPEIMLFIFLPALIFESGFALDARQMIKDLPPILMLAIPAMLMSTFVVGLGVWWALDIKLIVALVFGALISATDPVAVVALFKELGAPNRLNVLVEGESLLNDATAIVTFSILLGIAVEGGGVGWASIDDIFIDFIRVFIGGAIFGGLLGFFICELLYRLQSGISVILTTSIIIAYASFVIAEHTLHVSGVMAVVGSAVALRRFGVTRFRQDTTHSISEIWEVIALSCNSLLFLLVGLAVSTGDLFAQAGPIVVAIALVLFARALSVYSLVPLAVRWFRLPKISLGERHIMWWGGLKGGLAIAVVLSIPEDLPERQFLFELTLGIVLFTLLICAPTIRPLMEKLGLNRVSKGEDLERRNSLINARKKSQAYLASLASSKIIPRSAIEPLGNKIQLAFPMSVEGEHNDNHKDDEFFAIFRAYHKEREVLKSLYETGIISQYIYLDMNNGLHAMRESLRVGEGKLMTHGKKNEASMFQRLENSLLARIRESYRLSRILSKYQGLRLVQQVQRNLAHVLMCSSVIKMLDQQDDLDDETTAKVKSVYKARRKSYRKQLKQVRKQYPDFYNQYTQQLTTRSMFTSGLNQVTREYQHDDLSAKGFNMILRKVNEELKNIHKSPLIFSEQGNIVSEYLTDVDLFEDLNDKDMSYLENNATIINFLADDTIIGVHQKGDYFYILVQGVATVWIKDAFNRDHFMAELIEGDFMGESALLDRRHEQGKHQRTATIKAQTPCTLIRFTTQVMSTILWKYPVIYKTLREVNQARVSDTPKSTDKLREYKPTKKNIQKLPDKTQ